MFKYLFPNYFKKVGLGLIILSVCLYLSGSLDQLVQRRRENLIVAIILTGYIMIINSREKVEDERTMQIRYKAISHSFFFLLFMTLAIKVIDFVYWESNLAALPTKFVSGNSMGYIYISLIVYYTYFTKYLKDDL